MVELLIAVFAASAQAAGPSPEAVSARSAQAFAHEIGFAAPLFVPAREGVVVQAAAAQPVKELKLADLLNKQQKTELAYTMGGKSVWISGAFDRSGESAFVSLLVDGEKARFYNIKGVLDNKVPPIAVGTAKYKVSIKGVWDSPLDSDIVFQNESNRKDKVSVTLRDMIDAVGKAGERVKAGGFDYALFYYDEVKGEGEGSIDAKSQVLTFLHVAADGEFAVWVIPASELADGKLRAYKMRDDKAVGLQIAAGQLKVFDQP